jgi:hypothetical protein
MTVPKGYVADHWTWRDGKPSITGWHRKLKRGEKAEAAPPVTSGRSVVALAMRPARPKREQGQLL